MSIFSKKNVKQEEELEETQDSYYYRLHSSSSLGSSWHNFRTASELADYFNSCRSSNYIATKFTIELMSNWSELEIEELERLKAKYEPDTRRS